MINHPTTDLVHAPAPPSDGPATPPVPPAVCARPGADPDLWFPEDWQDPEPARAACLACPLRARCLAWALAHPVEAAHGVWGASTAAERTALRVTAAAAGRNGAAA